MGILGRSRIQDMTRPISTAEHDQIERLLELPEDRLLTLIGYSIPETAGVLFSPEEAQGRAERWLSEMLEKHREKICEAYEKLSAREEYKDDVTVVSGLADLLASLALGVGGFTVAALLVLRGLRKLCGKEDAPRQIR